MRFSVLIPAYNAENTLAETLESLVAQTTSTAFEIVIVDDGSRDETASTARGFIEVFEERGTKLKLISQPNQGTSFALARAASEANGEFLIQLGADDILLPTHLLELETFMAEYPGYDIYAANAQLFNNTDLLSIYHPNTPPYDAVFSLCFTDMIRANGIYGTAAIRRSNFESVGGFDHRFHSEDYYLWLKLLLSGSKHIYQPRVLSRYRQHEGQRTADPLIIRRDDIAILESFLHECELNENQRKLIKARIRKLQINVSVRETLHTWLGKPTAEKFIAFLKGRK